MVCVTHEPGEYSIALNDVENVVEHQTEIHLRETVVRIHSMA